MSFGNLILAPWRVAQGVVRAADDVNAIAERARRNPDPVEEVRELLQALLVEIRPLVSGGRDLRLTGESLDAHTLEVISGGRELTETAKEISDQLAEFNAALPRIVSTLDSVEELESSVETVAETVEPLQGVTRGVGRVARRLSSADG